MARSYGGFIAGLFVTFVVFDVIAFALGVSLYYRIRAIVYIGFFARLMVHAMDTRGKNKGFLVGYCIGSTGIIIG